VNYEKSKILNLLLKFSLFKKTSKLDEITNFIYPVLLQNFQNFVRLESLQKLTFYFKKKNFKKKIKF
jgi:hypothetical protein